MTQKEAIQSIETYLRINRISQGDYSAIVFDNDIAHFNSKDILTVDYLEEIFTLYTEDGDFICELTKDNMVDIFPQVDEMVNCKICDGKGWVDNDPYDMDKIECEHDNLIYR
jgi:hypothetical protein